MKAALASWQHDRAVGAEKSRAEDELEALEKAASRERIEALELSNRLLFDRRGATEMYGSREYGSNQPKITTWFRSQMFAIYSAFMILSTSRCPWRMRRTTIVPSSARKKTT